jgi:hypothetical protein
MKFNLKNILPHIAAIGVFILFASVYFSPVWEGKQLKQSDVKQYQGASKEITDYRLMNGEEAMWTNTMFSGMPAYQISMIHKGNYMVRVAEVLRLGLPTPVGILFVMMLGFYIMGLCMKLNPWVAIVGSIAFGFASFNILYLGAGHLTKVNAVAYMAPTLGGLLLATRGKWLWGSIVFAFFLSLNISANHLQITYYLFILLGVVALAEGIRLLVEKQYMGLLKITGALLLATGLAVLPSASNLMTTYAYSKYSTRGDSDISVVPKGTKKETKAKSGLDKSYILEYNFGPKEALSLFIPNAKGGNAEPIGNDESAMEAVRDLNYSQQISQSNHYWGGQLFSGGAIYLGAVAMFLFLVSLFLVKDTLRFPVLALSILCVLLSAKTGGVNFWFIDHFPMYNKFRDSKMILVIMQVIVPLMAMLLLDKLVKKEPLEGTKKFHYGVIGGVAVIGIVLFLVPSISGNFITADETKQFNDAVTQSKDPSQATMIQGLKAELIHVRESIYRNDAGRTVVFFVLTGLMLLLALMTKAKPFVWLTAIGLFVSIDEISIAKRYLNNEGDGMTYEKYEDITEGEIPYMPDKADFAILQNEEKNISNFGQKASEVSAKYAEAGLYTNQPSEVSNVFAQFTALQLNSNYRVFSFDNPFNETVTCFFHKSIGGYHGAKLKRYQQLVDFYIQSEIQKANQSIGAFKMAKLQGYAQTMGITQEQAKAVYDTISVAGATLADSCQILNMLNTKYLILKRSDIPVVNPNANGNAWFVNRLKVVNSANDAMLGLGKLNTKTEAILDLASDEAKPASSYGTDSMDRIRLTRYATKALTYVYQSKHKGFVVFSEIYYPEGWICKIDGKEVPYHRVNYILRGTEVPAGKHEITWSFEPKSYITGSKYSMLGSILLLLGFFGIGGLELKKSLTAKKQD